ncbi:type I pullulanase [Streptococcus vestibularis]|uniref:type I pullulanase n=1 Tax=Streptococcus vestibularis TaxID=1343 RepID=UPI001D0A8B36|nr:type I pullulanase [Streptococcus vestibularis]MCB8555675.1 type I pullulanase [Streptococcus vestibularis]MCB8586528.1 type I pullulanase [Streptococcus vestibularis]
MDNLLTVHFHSMHGDYSRYSMWKWLDGYWGEEAHFSREDDFGLVGQLTFPANRFIDYVNLLVKTEDWSKQTHDYRIRRFLGDAPNAIWVVEGDPTVYYSKQAAMTSHSFEGRDQHAFDMALRRQEFDQKWGFQGWLGHKYEKGSTEFRLWAPLARRVQLLLFKKGSKKSKVIKMSRGTSVNKDRHEMNTHGVWSVSVPGDLDGLAYQFRVYHEESFYQDTRDPYSIALSLNNKKSLVVNPERLVPKGYQKVTRQGANWRNANACSSVICEMHLRDFSISETSGVKKAYRGTYLGACQKGTKNDQGDVTGFDYIKRMGYNYVQLQPVFDHHKTYDKNGNLLYNWGYDPENYNVPDRQFAVDQKNPLAPILELKKMIQVYHEAGIGVIMDVVYNHTYSSYSSPFQLAVPAYYYRMHDNGSFQDGSGCGNETASEKEMYRKYMIDSLTYWAEEFGVDGFRFDLMGLHDVATMNAIRSAMDDIDPRILIYGEGWDMGIGLPVDQKAKKDNAALMPRIGFFNDNARDAVKGAEVYGHISNGYVSGAPLEDKIAKSLLGSRGFVNYLMPGQVLNYIEAHDNYNLNDLMHHLHPHDLSEDIEKRIYLANALNLTMQGMCFMQLGQEFQRSKMVATGEDGNYTEADVQRAMNSYNAPDEVNRVDWNQVTLKKELVDKIAKLIERKKTVAEFSYRSYADIYDNLYVTKADFASGIVELHISGKLDETLVFDNMKKDLEIY